MIPASPGCAAKAQAGGAYETSKASGYALAVLLSTAMLPIGSSLSAGVDSSQSLKPQAATPGFGNSAPFRAMVDLPTFMQHVLSPAADVVWRASGTLADATGEHNLAPTTDAQWEVVVSGSATLAEATNALMIPPRQRDAAWFELAVVLGNAANDAYRAAEARDAQAIAVAGERIDAACTNCHKHYGVE